MENTQIQKQNNQQVQRTPKQQVDLRELTGIAAIFCASGMFDNIKTEAQAAVKIMAGQAFGFDPITSMAHVHLIQGKAYLGAKLQAALIKASGRYNYKIIEHTETACSVQFMGLVGGEWKAMSLPIKYTIAEATNAGLMSNPTWKKYPKAMLFASCIRQGMTRLTPDLLRQSNDAPAYADITRAMDDVEELKLIDTTDEAIEGEVETIDADASRRADLETIAFDLLKDLTGGDGAKVKQLLKGREISNMSDEQLQECVTLWQDMEVN